MLSSRATATRPVRPSGLACKSGYRRVAFLVEVAVDVGDIGGYQGTNVFGIDLGNVEAAGIAIALGKGDDRFF